jgi:hypothetical protein
MPLAVDTGTIMILVAVLALPIGAIAFAMGAGNALREIGRGRFAIEQDLPQSGGSSPPISPERRQDEIRQMVQARSDRRVDRGDEPLDVEAEMEELLAAERGAGSLGADRGLREEVRQLVVARNERRARQGKEPLDVEREIERQLRELENLGQ